MAIRIEARQSASWMVAIVIGIAALVGGCQSGRSPAPPETEEPPHEPPAGLEERSESTVQMSDGTYPGSIEQFKQVIDALQQHNSASFVSIERADSEEIIQLAKPAEPSGSFRLMLGYYPSSQPPAEALGGITIPDAWMHADWEADVSAEFDVPGDQREELAEFLHGIFTTFYQVPQPYEVVITFE